MWKSLLFVLISIEIIHAEDPCVGCPFIPRTLATDTTCSNKISNSTVLFTIRSTEADSCFYIFGGCRLYQVITTTNECIEYDDILSKNVCQNGQFYLYGTDKAIKSIGCVSSY